MNRSARLEALHVSAGRERRIPAGESDGFKKNNCAWCSVALSSKRRDAKFCNVRCRQASWRFGVQRADLQATDRPFTFAYADPPYPGTASYYPENQEVDHSQLIGRLSTSYPDGWALSTSAKALPEILAHCPSTVRVCAWVRTVRPGKSRSPLSAWEPVLISGGRALQTDKLQTVTDALIYRGRFRAFPGALIGMKPPAFSVWLFQMLGARPGDTLIDLFPGSGAVSLAWNRYSGGNP